uniref:UspA domain-containing protein n=1 Tax=Triticum urartu TaxID=4572 RepID=A0A8R7PIF0_TRIUA
MAAQAAPPPPPEQKMMVAIDESECSHYALEWALRNLAPRRLILFTVQPFSPLSYLPAGSPRKPRPRLFGSLPSIRLLVVLAKSYCWCLLKEQLARRWRRRSSSGP